MSSLSIDFLNGNSLIKANFLSVFVAGSIGWLSTAFESPFSCSLDLASSSLVESLEPLLDDFLNESFLKKPGRLNIFLVLLMLDGWLSFDSGLSHDDG